MLCDEYMGQIIFILKLVLENQEPLSVLLQTYNIFYSPFYLYTLYILYELYYLCENAIKFMLFCLFKNIKLDHSQFRQIK